MRIAVGVMCSALVLAGCAAETAGEAAPQGTVTGEPVFSPCDDIPDEAIVAIGMDPATEERDIMDVHQPGWNICMWKGSTDFLTVFATIYTLEDIRSNDKYVGFTDHHIEGRAVTVFRDRNEAAGTTCDVAMASGSGAVMISIAERVGADSTSDPCVRLIDKSEQLLPHLPE